MGNFKNLKFEIMKLILCKEGRFIIIKKYFDIIYKKMKKYDKKAANPFLKAQYAYNPFKSIYEQTYIWVENEKKDES